MSSGTAIATLVSVPSATGLEYQLTLNKDTDL